MRTSRFVTCIVGLLLSSIASAVEMTETFDRDPGWDGHNNRGTVPQPQMVKQDFGFSPTNNAGGKAAGEIGGLVTPTGEAAFYAKPIPNATFQDKLSASGTFAATGRQFHVLVGFFNDETLNEWRIPNSIALRLYGRGDVFYAYVEYMTSKWRAGGDNPGGFALIEEPGTGKKNLKGFASKGAVHHWSLEYDPAANKGHGSVTVKIDGETAVCQLDPGHKLDGASFNHFGLLSIPKHFDQGGEIWLDDITVNGAVETFDQRPTDWKEVGNRRTYTTHSVRPRFDFGYSPTNFAGGRNSGELGGVIFRGDARYPERMAYYGDRLEILSPQKPLRAAGRICMKRGISDSTTLVGFFHSKDTVAVTENPGSGFPMNFLGFAIEGPSREGFLVYPVYRFPKGADGYARVEDLPHIYPDGKTGEWALDYDPNVAGNGRLTVTYNGQSVPLDLPAGHRDASARFDRFGIVTTWIDGNAQEVYLDDLRYTAGQ